MCEKKDIGFRKLLPNSLIDYLSIADSAANINYSSDSFLCINQLVESTGRFPPSPPCALVTTELRLGYYLGGLIAYKTRYKYKVSLMLLWM